MAGLVLSRQRKQVIMIGDDITVTVEEIRGDKVRLRIDAPRDVRVDRQEVHEQREKEAREYRKAGKQE